MAAADTMLQQQNGVSLPFDRSSSLRYPAAAAGQKKQALPRSSCSRVVNQKCDSTVENTMKKGTTIMAVPCVNAEGWCLSPCVNAEGWCLSGDTLFTITDPDGPETFMTGLKVAKANDRSVALVTGNMGIAEILLLEVRAYPCLNEGKENYGEYSNIYNRTLDKIIKKLKSLIRWCLDKLPIETFITGALVLIDRKVTDCLVLEVVKQPDTTYTICGCVKSMIMMGSEKVDVLYNKISEIDSLEVMKTKMLIAMELAAEEDKYTGGMRTLFTRGKKSGRECVYTRDFRGHQEMRTCFEDLDVGGN